MEARRLGDGAIIGPPSDPSLGSNIQGPSLVRAPSWIDDPLGGYYLYFADHKGSYIRLAYADEVDLVFADDSLQAIANKALERETGARGLRSIVLAGNEANAAALAGQPGVVPFAPLTKVLPWCRAAVLSGALGSVAASLAAGIPIVIHPQLWDQFWHGRQVTKLGVGALARNVGHVASRVESVLEDDATRAARELSIAMADEDGPGIMVAAVERAVANAR